jgi:hypothetical protein
MPFSQTCLNNNTFTFLVSDFYIHFPPLSTTALRTCGIGCEGIIYDSGIQKLAYFTWYAEFFVTLLWSLDIQMPQKMF